jgi:hypothetical protein
MASAVVLDSRVPGLIERMEQRAELIVEKSTMDIEARAKENLIAHGSVDSGFTLGSIEGRADGYSGEVSVGAATAVYIELGTGVRGEAYEFPGKPQGIAYDPNWTRGIPKDPMRGFAFLIPAVESERPAFDLAVGQLFG